VKNIGINAKCDFLLESATRKVLAQSEDFYLFQGFPLDYIEYKKTWQTNGEKEIEEQNRGFGYES